MNDNTDEVEVGKIEPVDHSRFQPLSELLSVISNRTRLAIISIALDHGEVCACRLQEALDLPQPTVTVNLHKLYDSGLFVKRQSWRYTYYSISKDFEPFLRDILDHKSSPVKYSEEEVSGK